MIIDFTEEEIQDFIQLLKNLDYNDEQKQDLIENFQILALFPSSERKDLIEKPISETTIKAILGKYGDESISWVTQNFRLSNLRDIILIGIYTFASDEQREQFELQIQDKLTNNPDSYKAKKSSIFPFKNYYSDNGFLGIGKLAQNFPDLLKRRHPFAIYSFNPKDATISFIVITLLQINININMVLFISVMLLVDFLKMREKFLIVNYHKMNEYKV